ncbi:site-specific DNA-methyltransferase [Leucobacter chromiireducens]|uniref:Site-specific DNA-methyltransferase n=1 Tax=Leucobacter chromiireducens subsp. chromiireducens TaxID=660067 RepID=A0ABS1SND4_9MICO|nr:site-specific DNA-methyltransferase [Leucobacter chromiireducens]MBL3689484.1 site-specific DNA-methyltransferase [Leucobacter chromiireducens subsp. chromiireducens]
MSRLSDLLRTLEQLDPKLAKDLDEEIRPLQKRLPFGLNFERHAPEAVELAGHRIRKTNKVRVLPPRGSTERGDQRLWHVDSISGGIAEVSTPNGEERDTQSVPVEDLVLVAEFRDRIYPGLRPDGSVERGGDKPFHTVINGENFHVLELLTFTHEHSVDAIYIDPPYNTGSRDWKYNNDYVEGDDLYRHSKWLAFMERRLKLAKRLLKPEDSVLIVTIDEKEYLRLGLLLEQTFPEADIQMITSVINPKGSARQGRFSRTDEYIFIVMFGDSHVAPWNTDMIREPRGAEGAPEEVRWAGLLRNGEGSLRTRIPSMFYPIFLDSTTGAFHSVGEPPSVEVRRDSISVPDGAVAVWPVDGSGRELMWRLNPASLREYLSKGYAKFGRRDPETGRRSPSYLQSGILAKIESGDVVVNGYDNEGAAQVSYLPGKRTVQPMTLWNRISHSASEHGATFVKALLPGRKFPYPKSLYAVEDALRFFVSGKPDAVVLDFFSGSGTTAHAVMRLNKQDDGRRQCISVTNNEVSAEEQTKLRKQGLRPGDPEWEQWGICDYITKPRIRAALTGLTPDGAPIKGDYKFVDEFPMADGFDENAAFFTLSYESPWMVEADKAFAAIAPMLWLRAGAVGERIDSIEGGWAVADSYGILKDLDLASDFVAELQRREGIRIAYVVTDDDGRYQQVASEIPGIETVRLYEDYLRNCESTGDI